MLQTMQHIVARLTKTLTHTEWTGILHTSTTSARHLENDSNCQIWSQKCTNPPSIQSETTTHGPDHTKSNDTALYDITMTSSQKRISGATLSIRSSIFRPPSHFLLLSSSILHQHTPPIYQNMGNTPLLPPANSLQLLCTSSSTGVLLPAQSHFTPLVKDDKAPNLFKVGVPPSAISQVIYLI